MRGPICGTCNQACEAIGRFVDGLDAASYAQNALITAAVERKFEVIGEALNQLSKLFPELAERVPNRREIIGFRNVLIHGYATIDHARVWRIVETSLPGLHATMSTLLTELGPA